MQQEWKMSLVEIYSNLNDDQCTTLAIVFWALRYCRNKLLHDGQRDTVQGIVSFILAYKSDITLLGSCLKYRNDEKEARWMAPTGEIIKANFDASYVAQMKHAVTGSILRNSEGMLMGSSVYPFDGVIDPTTAKALACLETIRFAIELGLCDVYIEGDALTIIKKINMEETDRSAISTIIEEIKAQKQRFWYSSFLFVRRSANKAAHQMAAWGRLSDGPRYWIEEAPVELDDILIADKREGIR